MLVTVNFIVFYFFLETTSLIYDIIFDLDVVDVNVPLLKGLNIFDDDKPMTDNFNNKWVHHHKFKRDGKMYYLEECFLFLYRNHSSNLYTIINPLITI